MKLLEPTYKLYEIVERIDCFGPYELKILSGLIEEEKKRYSLHQLTIIKGLIANRYGDIRIEENKK